MSSQMEKDRVSSAEVDTDASSEEAARKPVQRRKKKGGKRQKKSSSGPLDQLPLGDTIGGDQVGNTVGGVTNTLGNVAGGALDKGGDSGGKSDTLRLRLDLNLDIEIQLKARIHGDLELALLDCCKPALACIISGSMLELLSVISTFPVEGTDSAMPSNPPTPKGAPTHTTYEFAIPVRKAKSPAPPMSDSPQMPKDSPLQSSKSSPQQSSQPSPDQSPELSPKDTPKDSPKQSKQHIEIPKITPLSGPSPAELARGLEGKFVDEFGNILDWDGTVLGRVDGDLPSMVGRPVSDSGEILDTDGEVVGHVSENYSRPSLKPLSGTLKVDDEGNIYDDQGNIVGKIHGPPGNHDGSKNPSGQSGGQQNAPKPPAAPRPDELYLDVKSTFDGIQLIIKIPTVFNRGTDSQ
ncbi:Fc.00g009460.m01.CDS01 [Cosmosporella sp. VM-42]